MFFRNQSTDMLRKGPNTNVTSVAPLAISEIPSSQMMGRKSGIHSMIGILLVIFPSAIDRASKLHSDKTFLALDQELNSANICNTRQAVVLFSHH